MNNSLIILDKVIKKFANAKTPSVYETSLNINEGEFITILGSSGCGKTTLLKMINRLYDPTSGKIYINGEDISKISAVNLRRRIGYVIQQTGLFEHLTIEENIAIVPKILNWDKDEINERIDYLLDLVGLSPQTFRKRHPNQLSGGQQQRVGLARAMAANPKIMLMDEPFGAIDSITRANLQEELLKIQKLLNKTILFVTHDVDEALKLGDKVLIMNEGKVQQFDTPVNILLHPANEFVSSLVNSNDLFQKLSIIKVKEIMQKHDNCQNNHSEIINQNDNLKNALNNLIENNLDSLKVKDDNNNIIGTISINNFKNFRKHYVKKDELCLNI
ncbi:MAG: ABC transporter ATP-binding protein [bacterium]